MTTCYVGSEYPIGVEFRDRDGALADPTTVTLTIEDPAGAEASYTYAAAQVLRDAVGLFKYYVSCTLAGHYKWKMVGTGAVVAVIEGTWEVEVSAL